MTNRFWFEIRPVGNYCPNDCSFCYQKHSRPKIPYFLDKNILVRFFEELVVQHLQKYEIKEINIVFHGGEPAFDGGYFVAELASLLSKKAKRFKLNTHFLCHVSGFLPLDVDLFFKCQINVALSRNGFSNFLINPKKTSNGLYNAQELIFALIEANLLTKQFIVISSYFIENPHELLTLLSEENIPSKLLPDFNFFYEMNRNIEMTSQLERLLSLFILILNKASEYNICIWNVEPLNRP